jgi:hypothetical protein
MVAPRLRTRVASVLSGVQATVSGVCAEWRSLMERTDYWIGAGRHNLIRYLAGEITGDHFHDLDVHLLAGMRNEVPIGYTGDVLEREGLDELFVGLIELDYYSSRIAVGLKTLRAGLDQQLARPCPEHATPPFTSGSKAC